jgi:hypothetical protein
MSRHRSASSYAHAIRKIGDRHYRLSWTVDRHYANSRLRHPRDFTRDTDRIGAERFAKRWKIAMPQPITMKEDR